MAIVGLKAGVQHGGWSQPGFIGVGIRSTELNVSGNENDLKTAIANGLNINYLLVITDASNALMLDLVNRTVYRVSMPSNAIIGWELSFDIAKDFKYELTNAGCELKDTGYDFFGNLRLDNQYDFVLGETRWYRFKQEQNFYEANLYFFVEYCEYLKSLGYVFPEGLEVTYPTIDLTNPPE